jgi:hypothetical protein
MEVTGLTPHNLEFTFKTKIFGEHNALNCLATFAVLHANQILENMGPAVKPRDDKQQNEYAGNNASNNFSE